MLVGDDAWLQIIYYLDEKQVYALHSCGSPGLSRIIAKRRSIFAKARWPSRVDSESTTLVDLRTEDLNLFGTSSVITNGALELRFLPKTLTRLNLGIKYGRALPFWVSDLDQADAQLALLGQSLPFLHTLETTFRVSDQIFYWTLPPSLTYFASHTGTLTVLLSPLIPLPEKLQVFISKDLVKGDPQAMLEAFRALISLRQLALHSVTFKPLPIFPKLEMLHVGRYSGPCSLSSLPSVTALCADAHLDASSPAHPLKYWRTSHHHFVDYAKLPRSLVKWTTIDSKRRRIRLRSIDYQSVCLLPPSFAYLSLFSHPHSGIPKDTFSSLPQNLLLLDIKHVAFDLNILLPAAPPTLTALRTHGINPVTVRLLSRFAGFQELGMYGGRMTANLARLLPRSLRSLTLHQVGLTTKGKFQSKGSGEIQSYSKCNPDTTALDASLLPPLTYLNVKPSHTQYYWHTHFYEILKGIPTSIEHLVLDYRRGWEALSIYPNSTTGEADRTKPSDLFLRLVNLKNLFFFASKYNPLDQGLTAKSLPKKLTAFACSMLTADDVPHLPSKQYPDYFQYEDSYDAWRGPKEKDCFSFFEPSMNYEPFY